MIRALKWLGIVILAIPVAVAILFEAGIVGLLLLGDKNLVALMALMGPDR